MYNKKKGEKSKNGFWFILFFFVILSMFFRLLLKILIPVPLLFATPGLRNNLFVSSLFYRGPQVKKLFKIPFILK
jgi:hypothetical protein